MLHLVDTATSHGGDRVAVARSVEAVRALAAASDISWPHPDPDPEYFLTVLGALPNAIRPHVIRLERAGGEPVTVVARVEEIDLEAKLGYLTLHRPTVRCLTVVHAGVHGVETPEDGRRVLAVLRNGLAEGEADVLRFLGLPTESPLFGAAASAPRWPWRDHGVSVHPHWRVAVPDSIDEFMAARSRNTRQNVRRYGKRFEEEMDGRLTLRRFGAGLEVDLDRLCADLEEVAAKTYQRGLGVGFTGEHLQRQIMGLGLRRGRYLAWVLDVDGVPSAFWDGTIQAGTFHIGSPGYDPALGHHRIGTWLQMRMMEDLCARDDVRALDYGMGDAQYKRSFGDQCQEDAILHVFAPTLTGLRVNAARTVTAAATRAIRRALAATDLEERVKRGWRRRLQPRQTG